jgi:integrase
VETAFYAIQWAHNLAGVPSPTAHPTVIAVREAANRICGKHRKNRKEPISAGCIKALISKANLKNLLELRNIYAFVLAFAGFFRIDEVLHIKRNHIRFDGDRIVIKVERSKTDQLRLGSEVVISRIPGSFACPVSILESYLELAGIQSLSEVFLFRPISKTSLGYRLVGINKPICYSTIREAFKSSFKNIDAYSTHSLRAGGPPQQLMQE